MEKGEKKCPKPRWPEGARRGGFLIERLTELSEIRTTVYLIRHEETGARILDLHCDDRENVFAIAFLTPPSKSNGLPHILEHSVLAGSVNYPVKDAFNELLRSTLQTFLNAFTYPDRTVYPVASQVHADFYNLARVYLDLVFRPLLRRETFAQEGYHFELAAPDNPQSPLLVSGVVYNEMKGAYSSPDNLMYKAIQEHLFPDTVYRFDSGGEPEEIVKLTYDEFVAFHRTYYTPANACFFFYGNIPPEDHLEFLSGVLASLDKRPAFYTIPRQRRWRKPRVVKRPFPILGGEDPSKKGVVNVAWLLTENNDVFETLILHIVSGILVGTAAGPLRKALIDSRLGEDLSPVTGFEAEMRETFFVAGLRGTDSQKARDIEALILRALNEIVARGIDRDLVEAVLHQVEFAGKEIVRGAYPYGLKLMGQAFQTWPYGGDPVQAINFPVLIEEVIRRWEKRPRLFEEAIEKWLLANNHRLLCIMEPSFSYLEEREKKMATYLAKVRKNMKESDLARIREEMNRLRVYQMTPDSPAAVGKMPRLKRSDLERKIETIPTEIDEEKALTVLKHDLFTNGIAYLDLAFDISSVPEEDVPYLPLLGKLMGGMGAAGLNYEEMVKRVALNLGGISIHPTCGLLFANKAEVWQRMVVRARFLYRKAEEAMATLGDLITSCDFTDEKRVEDLLMEQKNRLASSIVPSGHLVAKMMAASSFSLPAWREEQWEGRTQLIVVSRALESFRENPHAWVEKMMELKDKVMRRAGLVVNLTADEEGLHLLKEKLPTILDRLHDAQIGTLEGPFLPERRHRGVAVPAEVSYVAGAIPAPGYGEKAVAAMMVASKYLSNGYLYRTIRVQGGAYGGSCVYDPASGVFTFLSYRDPHIVRTLEAYREAARLLFGGTLEEEEVEKAVIASIGAMDRPLDPAGKGFVALTRFLAGITDDYRQALREAILDMSPANLSQEVREVFAGVEEKMVIAVLGSEERLNAANEELSEKMLLEPLFT